MHKDYRLKRREDFNRVYRRGRSAANHQLVVYYLDGNGQDHFRLGVSVSKKVGNAVVRNRLRRLLKEIVRLHALRIETAMDFILIARKPAAEMEYAALEKSVLHALKRAGLLR